MCTTSLCFLKPFKTFRVTWFKILQLGEKAPNTFVCVQFAERCRLLSRYYLTSPLLSQLKPNISGKKNQPVFTQSSHIVLIELSVIPGGWGKMRCGGGVFTFLTQKLLATLILLSVHSRLNLAGPIRWPR